MKISILLALIVSGTMVTYADDGGVSCKDLPTADQLRTLLNNAASAAGVAKYGVVGGLFQGTKMWAAVVNSDGEVCAFNTSTTDPRAVWPGSQAIAKSKAYTANAFSLDDFALSTARLYTFTQPGHSLNSLGQSNVFNSEFLAPPAGQDGGKNQIAGGLIFFGGGLPLYKNGKIIGGLGVSGDTACADHEIAKRVRDGAGLNPAGGMLADDIVYTTSVFAHPVCLNTYLNGAKIGDEAPASYPFVP